MDSKQGLHIITLANSIIGVSILAMPYCFKQCGIILSIILLICSSIISRLACHFLLKSAIKARLRTFEFLAYHAFGSLGKFIIEIGMIGFLLGTCIAFFVVMGDLSPQIVAQMTQTENTDRLRTYILIALALFCVLPLGLLRNVDSLSAVCTATIGFYACLVIKIMGESAPHIILRDWYDKVEFWRPDGILQCIPIFSMALFCQTQLFEIYQAIPNASLEKMNGLIRVAVNICTCVYIFVGVFGYIALSHESNFSGNILLVFKPSFMTEVMKIGFVLSVAFSFPLIIFPCRASLYSLLYKPTYTLHETSVMYIPEGKFKVLTFFIVLISLIIGIYIPNIELVLGLVGSTIGVMICVLFPAACFICMTSKNTNERILAQLMLIVGIIVMVLGTYANLYAIEQVANSEPIVVEKSNSHLEIMITLQIPEQTVEKISENKAILKVETKQEQQLILDKLSEKIDEGLKEIRHEPPQPEAPDDNAEKVPQLPIEIVHIAITQIPEIKKSEYKNEIAPIEDKPRIEVKEVSLGNVDNLKENSKAANKETESEEIKKIIPKKGEEVDSDAIKKEEKELLEQEKKEVEDNNLVKQQKLVEKQQMLVEEQKKILQEMKIESRKIEKEQNELKKAKINENWKAVKNIENLAKLAIESIVETNTKLNFQINPNVLSKNNVELNKVSMKPIPNNNNVNERLPPIPIMLASKSNLTDHQQNEVPQKKLVAVTPNILNILKGSPNKDINDEQLKNKFKKFINQKIAEQSVEVKVDETKIDKSKEIEAPEQLKQFDITNKLNNNISEQLKINANERNIEYNIANSQTKMDTTAKPNLQAIKNAQEAKKMQNNDTNGKQESVKGKENKEEIQNNAKIDTIRRDLLSNEFNEMHDTGKHLIRDKRDTEIHCEKGDTKYKTETPLIRLVNKFTDPQLEGVKLDAVNLGLVNANSGVKVLTRHLKSIAQNIND